MIRKLVEETITWNGVKLSETVLVPAGNGHSDIVIEVDDGDDCGQNLAVSLQPGVAEDSFLAIYCPTTLEFDTFEVPAIAVTKGTHYLFGPLPGSLIGRYGLQLTLTASGAPTNEKETTVTVWQHPRY